MNQYMPLQIGAFTHVLTFASDRGDKIPGANYKGTGKALVGVLKKGETMTDFINRQKKRK